MTDAEFLSMYPACLDLLLRRLEVLDRKRLVGPARLEAALINVNRGKESWEENPEPYTAKDFLPELPEERRKRLRREAEEAAAEAARTPEDLASDPSFLAWKASFASIGKKT